MVFSRFIDADFIKAFDVDICLYDGHCPDNTEPVLFHGPVPENAGSILKGNASCPGSVREGVIRDITFGSADSLLVRIDPVCPVQADSLPGCIGNNDMVMVYDKDSDLWKRADSRPLFYGRKCDLSSGILPAEIVFLGKKKNVWIVEINAYRKKMTVSEFIGPLDKHLGVSLIGPKNDSFKGVVSDAPRRFFGRDIAAVAVRDGRLRIAVS